MQKRQRLPAETEPSVLVRLPVTRGRSAHREVLLGFAPAKVLHACSFADVLDEETGRGYQRPFSDQHSLDFRRYIGREGSATIPLTFNLRPGPNLAWRIIKRSSKLILELRPAATKPLAQVDCQHRLGYLADSDLELPFMTFVGLTRPEELEIFSVINSKAKGLSSSLLDYHAAHLAQDLGKDRPELFIALHLNESPGSPWHKQLDLGGRATSGLKRRASLRTMQKAVRKFLLASSILENESAAVVAPLVSDYWCAVTTVWRSQWSNPRRHFLTKGIGVYALMGLLADLYNEAKAGGILPTKRHWTSVLFDFSASFDWTNTGPLKGLGGESGAEKALELLRSSRAAASPLLQLVKHG